MSNRNGWKKPLTNQQKEERLEWLLEVSMEGLEKANHSMRVVAMRDTADIMKKLNNRKLCPVFKIVVLWTGGRLENGMQDILGKNKSQDKAGRINHNCFSL